MPDKVLRVTHKRIWFGLFFVGIVATAGRRICFRDLYRRRRARVWRT
jgi:hypothetical protein